MRKTRRSRGSLTKERASRKVHKKQKSRRRHKSRRVHKVARKYLSKSKRGGAPRTLTDQLKHDRRNATPTAEATEKHYWECQTTGQAAASSTAPRASTIPNYTTATDKELKAYLKKEGVKDKQVINTALFLRHWKTYSNEEKNLAYNHLSKGNFEALKNYPNDLKGQTDRAQIVLKYAKDNNINLDNNPNVQNWRLYAQ